MVKNYIFNFLCGLILTFFGEFISPAFGLVLCSLGAYTKLQYPKAVFTTYLGAIFGEILAHIVMNSFGITPYFIY